MSGEGGFHNMQYVIPVSGCSPVDGWQCDSSAVGESLHVNIDGHLVEATQVGMPIPCTPGQQVLINGTPIQFVNAIHAEPAAHSQAN